MCAGLLAVVLLARPAGAARVPTTTDDFHLSGTQIGDVAPGVLGTSSTCIVCHGGIDADVDPHATWSGSLMALAGRDPLFRAQLTTANQDAAGVGYFCLRCHVPLSFVTGHAAQPDGSTLDATDLDGVTCHLCHAMVDPIYKPGVSPPEDAGILAALPEVPRYYGNASFVLDPAGIRRGPYEDPVTPHAWIASPFHRSGDLCGTCHDVGNPAVSREPDGSWAYNALGAPPPSEDLADLFPLERTYTEWKLSAFANGGVDMGGRFGGDAAGIVRTCQDCHMPRTNARACRAAPVRGDLARHDFAGAAAQVLDLIAAHTAGDAAVDQAAITRGRAKAVSMLERAASLTLRQDSATLAVRVTNESGHKLPTGHIEGRRVWPNLRYLDADGVLVDERGAYDDATATLDEASTTVYEMHVGLSPAAAALTGLSAGRTGHMSLADTIEKDNRIPPRGYTNAAFAAAGAPVVGWAYADGQHWDETAVPIPWRAARAVVTLYYQSTPRAYVEELRDNNVTDGWGETLHQLWSATGRGAPIVMATAALDLVPRPCATTMNVGQTRRTRVRPGAAVGDDRIAASGTLVLAASGEVSPGTVEVVVELNDGNGLYLAASLPPGAFHATGGRTFRYSDRTPPATTGGVRGLQLRLSADGTRIRYLLHARGGRRAFAAGAGSVRVVVGDRCFVDPADDCRRSPGGRAFACD